MKERLHPVLFLVTAFLALSFLCHTVDVGINMPTSATKEVTLLQQTDPATSSFAGQQIYNILFKAHKACEKPTQLSHSASSLNN